MFLNNGEMHDVTDSALDCMAIVNESSHYVDIALVIIPEGKVLGFVYEQEAIDAMAGELKPLARRDQVD